MHKSSGTTAAQADEEVLERVIALENRVGELEDSHERQQEDIHALARENRELRSSNEQINERVNDAEAELNELENEIDRAESSRGHIIEDVIDLEQQLGEESGVAMSPIERVSKMDAEDSAVEITPSIERAVAIFDHWKEWSEVTQSGRVLKDGLKNLLRTATSEKLAWRQVYRAAEALQELSKGQIRFVDDNKHGKMLLQPPSSARSSDCHSSSAATS